MKPRVRREDPDRSDPIRGWETLLRRDESPPRPDASPAESGSTESPPQAASDDGNKSWDDIATRAVERGYQVIEEQINEGRRIAEQFRGYSDDVRKANDDTTRLIERSLRFYTDVSYLWFELMETLLRNPALRTAAQQSPHDGAERDDHERPNGRGNGNGSHAGTAHNVEIEVISPYATSVTLDLRCAVSDDLAIAALRAPDDDKPPLTDVGFRHREDGPVLRIKIPQGQPSDTYSGVISDSRSRQPKGTLCVSVRSDEA
jgi:hypothetical protein